MSGQDTPRDQAQDGPAVARSMPPAAPVPARPVWPAQQSAGPVLGALPLALGNGIGSELRKPLGVSIVGGLLLSQLITLYTTPVVYLYFERLSEWAKERRARRTALRERAA